MRNAFVVTARDPWGRNVVVDLPECFTCEHEIHSGEVVVLGDDTYCLTHGALAAVSLLDEAAAGDEIAPRVREEAAEILRTLMARAGATR